MRAPAEVATELEPGLWPGTARVRPTGELEIGGIGVRELARQFGTPAFVCDEVDFRTRAAAWRAAFPAPGADVYYAGKAFLCTGVARWVVEEGLGLDVCTGGELAVAQAAGVPAERLVFHGNNKSEAELHRAVTGGVGRVVLDSPIEIVRLCRIARAAGRRQPVLVRLTPGVEAHTHSYVATGQEDSKFGFSLASGAAAAAVADVLAAPDALELVGVHTHIGSQILGTEGFALALERVAAFLAGVHRDLGVEVREVNLGGGTAIAYTGADATLPVADFAPQVAELLRGAFTRSGLRVPRLAVEPGRAIAGPSTVTVYEVGTVKELPGLRTYLSVDGGMSDNIRPALYGARYSARLASRTGAGRTRRSTVCGKHCESGDIVVAEVELPVDVEPGDLLAVPASGAYQRSMASTYNHVPRPPVVAVRDGAASLLLRRETEADLLALEAG